VFQNTAGSTTTNNLTYTPPDTGTAASVTTTGLSAGAHAAIVSIAMSNTSDTNDRSCGMSFTGGSVTASDNFAVINPRTRANATQNLFAGGAAYYVTFTGNVTFTASYRSTDTGQICTFGASSIVVQVIS